MKSDHTFYFVLLTIIAYFKVGNKTIFHIYSKYLYIIISFSEKHNIEPVFWLKQKGDGLVKRIRFPRWVPWMTLIFMFIGVFFVQELQIQSAISAASADPKTEVLISLITNLETETAALEERLATVRQDTEAVISQSTTGESQLSELQNQLTQQQIRAGITALEGPGIVIILDDNNSGLASAPSEDPNRYVIHYENLLYLVNDLRNAGAEGISINGQRIVVSSEIRCVGNVILVNTTRLAPPFEISAIGDPTALEKAVNNSTTYQQLALSGFPVNYKTTGSHSNKISLPAYTGSFSTKNLTSVTEEEA